MTGLMCLYRATSVAYRTLKSHTYSHLMEEPRVWKVPLFGRGMPPRLRGSSLGTGLISRWISLGVKLIQTIHSVLGNNRVLNPL